MWTVVLKTRFLKAVVLSNRSWSDWYMSAVETGNVVHQTLKFGTHWSTLVDVRVGCGAVTIAVPSFPLHWQSPPRENISRLTILSCGGVKICQFKAVETMAWLPFTTHEFKISEFSRSFGAYWLHCSILELTCQAVLVYLESKTKQQKNAAM